MTDEAISPVAPALTRAVRLRPSKCFSVCISKQTQGLGIPGDLKSECLGEIIGLRMTIQIEPQHALSPSEIDEIEDRLYEHNSYVTGCHDGQGLGFVIRDQLGRMIGVAAGYTWAGSSELKQMWVDKSYRGRGYARALLNAFVTEARSRGVRRIWVASYDFQAPGMYEKAGFKRMAEFEGWPEGHINVLLCKTLSDQED
jgi:ribosomal protein S18 acetylase RimI-like enzyme